MTRQRVDGSGAADLRKHISAAKRLCRTSTHSRRSQCREVQRYRSVRRCVTGTACTWSNHSAFETRKRAGGAMRAIAIAALERPDGVRAADLHGRLRACRIAGDRARHRLVFDRDHDVPRSTRLAHALPVKAEHRGFCLRIIEPLGVGGLLGLPNTVRHVQRRMRLPAIRPPNRRNLIRNRGTQPNHRPRSARTARLNHNRPTPALFRFRRLIVFDGPIERLEQVVRFRQNGDRAREIERHVVGRLRRPVLRSLDDRYLILAHTPTSLLTWKSESAVNPIRGTSARQARQPGGHNTTRSRPA